MKIARSAIRRAFEEASRAIRPMRDPLVAMVGDEPHIRIDEIRIKKGEIEFLYFGEVVATVRIPSLNLDQGDKLVLNNLKLLAKLEVNT